MIIFVPTDRGQIWAKATAKSVALYGLCTCTHPGAQPSGASLFCLVFDSYFHLAYGVGLKTIPPVILKSCQYFDGKYM